MANQLFIDDFPGGSSISSQVQTVRGSIALCGSAVSTGEPLFWNSLISGIGYNEVNRRGGGAHGSANALVTAFSASAGVVTATANNNFFVGQLVTFEFCTTTLGLLLNGLTFQIVSVTSTSFTFTSTATGSGSSETGMAVTANSQVFPLQGANGAIAATVTALSASGTALTVTAANTYLPGAEVVISVATGTLGPKLANLTLIVQESTSTAFVATMPSALSGTTGTGTASAINPPQPIAVQFWSELASGFVYQYSRTTGVLYVLTGAAAQSALTALSAGAYPSGVLADLIRYEAQFLKA